MDETTQRQVRVSDAEREAVLTELGEHFQAGRLDAAEHEERMARALGARFRSDLDDVLAELPRGTQVPGGEQPDGRPGAGWRSAERRFGEWQAAGRRHRFGRFPVPLIAAAAVITAITVGVTVGGWHHHAGFVWWPLLWLVPFMALRLLRWHRRGGRAWN